MQIKYLALKKYIQKQIPVQELLKIHKSTKQISLWKKTNYYVLTYSVCRYKVNVMWGWVEVIRGWGGEERKIQGIHFWSQKLGPSAR